MRLWTDISNARGHVWLILPVSSSHFSPLSFATQDTSTTQFRFTDYRYLFVYFSSSLCIFGLVSCGDSGTANASNLIRRGPTQILKRFKAQAEFKTFRENTPFQPSPAYPFKVYFQSCILTYSVSSSSLLFLAPGAASSVNTLLTLKVSCLHSMTVRSHTT